MHHRQLFFFQALVILLLGILHVTAMHWALYWYFPWLDLLSHFLGGLWVALMSMWLLAFVGLRTRIVSVAAVVITISILWEIFEWSTGIPREANFVFDTSLDLVMDMSGGLLGFFLGRRMIQSLAYESTETHTS